MKRDILVSLTTAATLILPLLAYAGDRPYYSVDYLVNELLYARRDGDREKAAKDLGKLADPRALPALQQAAIYDNEDDVRNAARKSIQRINAVHPPVVVAAAAPTTQPTPVAVAAPQPVYVAAPPVVYAPAPVLVAAPPPVFVAAPYYGPVFVRPVYAAPVYCAPVRHSFGFGFSYRHHH